jgi:small subunit ribosomal protein S20
MPNTKSAIKRSKIEEKRRIRNHAIKSRARTFVVKARQAIDKAPEEETTVETLRQAISELDRAASKGAIHRNNAARRKSRLVHRLKELTGDYGEETEEQE